MHRTCVRIIAATVSVTACSLGAPSASEIEFAAARGLAYLAACQRDDGSFRKTKYQVAAQGLAGLAFLSQGHTPRFGRYATTLRLGLRCLLTYQEPSGYFNDGGASRMYGHGFATLYLAEVVGMWGIPDEERRIRKALVRAIRLIELSQDRHGGWDYEPTPGGVSDCSVTVCQAMALRAARNIGIHVDKTVIDRALRYVRRAQAQSGGFRYRIGDSGGFAVVLNRVTLGCSAAGVCILNGLGEYDSDRARRGLEFLKKNYRSPFRFSGAYFYYTHYYAAQAFYVARGAYWEPYYRYITKELIDRQEPDGSWESRHGRTIQPTAMAVFILSVPRAVLPIIQRE